jgi:putative transposase
MEGADARYAKNAGAVFSLKYHVVWCPKYRRPVLTGAVERRLGELIRDAATRRDMKVHALEVMPDHIHLFIETDPRWAPAEFVGKIKANTSRVLREEFPHLRSRLPTLWSRSYFCSTVGAVSEATIRRYIEMQKGR